MDKVKIEEFKTIISTLYGKIYAYNDKLFSLCETQLKEGEIYRSIDIFDFYITSHAQAYLKNLYFGLIGNQGALMDIRCMMEGLTLKRMCQEGKISSLQEKLLQKQLFLIEYLYYKNPVITDIVNKILSPEKFEYDWNETKKYYKELLRKDYSDKEINEIVKSQIPFLCNPKLNFRKLIAEELGEEYASIYGYFSSLIHPSANTFYDNEIIAGFCIDFIQIIEKEYEFLPKTEYNLHLDFILTQSDISEKFIQICINQKEIIETIANVFEEKFPNNYVSNTLRVIAPYWFEFAIEKNLGLIEQIKCKWKCLLEVFAVFHYFYCGSEMDNEKFKLLDEHMDVQTRRNFNKDYSLDYAYSVYCNIFPSPCNREKFDKSFLKILGYTIDAKGQVKSLTEMVKSFVHHFDNEENEHVTLGKRMILDYLESQMLSHANGYMWFANRGAFMDVNSVIFASDVSLIFILKSVKRIFELHRKIEQTQKYKSIINILRNSIKKLNEFLNEKTQILAIPGVPKWNVN